MVMLRNIFILLFVYALFLPLLGDEYHTVKRGDTLSSIARQYNTTITTLKQLNNLKSDTIQVGKRLIVRISIPETDEQSIYYLVKTGDTLYSIAKRNNITVAQLMLWNNLRNEGIGVNQRLLIKNPTHTQEPPEAPSPLPTPNPIYHTVEENETLSSISRKYNMEVLDIIDFNMLTTFVIKPDQIIWLEPGHVVEDISIYTETQPEIESEATPPLLPDIIVEGPTPLEIVEDEPDPPAPDYDRENSLTHIVIRGENLYRIGLKYGVTADDLRRWNSLSNININPGQSLIVYAKTPATFPQTTPSTTRARMPLENIRVLSEFGIRDGRMHNGIDLGAPAGTPILAVLPGRVVFSGIQRGYGNVVIIEHDNFIMTVYGHNEANLVTLGDTIDQGQWVARVGNTGNTRTYHLHFEYRLKGIAKNPRELLSF